MIFIIIFFTLPNWKTEAQWFQMFQRKKPIHHAYIEHSQCPLSPFILYTITG